VAALIASARPDAVVHTAYAYAGGELWRVSADGAGNVARATAAAGRPRFVHMSTDFVFRGDGDRPLREDDPAEPGTEYGRAKLAGERQVAEVRPDAAIVRTSLIYGGAEPSPHECAALDAAAGRREMTFFDDELRSPVAAPDLAAALLELVGLDTAGALHVAGADVVSRLGFARLVAAHAGHDPDRLRGGSSAGTGRPRNVALDSSRARGLLRRPPRGVREVLGPG